MRASVLFRWCRAAITICSLMGLSAPAAVAHPTSALVFALLEDNRLLEVRAATGEIVAIRSLGPALATAPPRRGGHVLALDPQGRILYALDQGEPGGIDHLVAVALSGARIGTRYVLPRGVAFSSVSVGPRTGHLYLFGNQMHARGAVVAVLDQRTGRLLARWPVHQGDSHDWWIYQGAVSADERHVYLSYHGADTTGIDRLTIAGHGLHPCRSVNPPGVGCIGTHGGFALYGDGLLAATGEGPIEQIDATGRVARRFDSQLPGNHLMELVVDGSARRLYTVGPCGYTGGLSVVDLNESRTQVLAPAATAEQLATPTTAQHLLCGERFALVPPNLLAVGRTAVTVPIAGITGTLLLVDRRTGAVLRQVVTPAEPIDVAVAG